jgi:hypothetical protein
MQPSHAPYKSYPRDVKTVRIHLAHVYLFGVVRVVGLDAGPGGSCSWRFMKFDIFTQRLSSIHDALNFMMH